METGETSSEAEVGLELGEDEWKASARRTMDGGAIQTNVFNATTAAGMLPGGAWGACIDLAMS